MDTVKECPAKAGRFKDLYRKQCSDMKTTGRKYLSSRQSIVISVILSLTVVSFQFYTDYSRHTRFASFGKIARLDATFRAQRDANYAAFTFQTVEGATVSGFEKCGTEDDFNEKYLHKSVIYDRQKSNEYELLSDFQNYSFFGRVFFFFGIYGTVISVIVFTIISFIRRFIATNRPGTTSNY